MLCVYCTHKRKKKWTIFGNVMCDDGGSYIRLVYVSNSPVALLSSFSAMSLQRDIQGVHFHLNYGIESSFTLSNDLWEEAQEEERKNIILNKHSLWLAIIIENSYAVYTYGAYNFVQYMHMSQKISYSLLYRSCIWALGIDKYTSSRPNISHIHTKFVCVCIACVLCIQNNTVGMTSVFW